ncbi:hypothetical protein NHX12_032011 [Muraenolepis orangiensis]|uniref:Ig-like domain-containing protein n=1 Tax=Muraenolepis orangiensis TaxID=630683 RepID=A0A9Q0E8J9_9TELE|nr:hypothetical protein NHX12_032011 [Muraenolepis orangiensis]
MEGGERSQDTSAGGESGQEGREGGERVEDRKEGGERGQDRREGGERGQDRREGGDRSQDRREGGKRGQDRWEVRRGEKSGQVGGREGREVRTGGREGGDRSQDRWDGGVRGQDRWEGRRGERSGQVGGREGREVRTGGREGGERGQDRMEGGERSQDTSAGGESGQEGREGGERVEDRKEGGERGLDPCPLEAAPPAVVMPYGGSLLVHCRATALAPQGVDMGLESTHGGTSINETRSVIWSVDNVTYWDLKGKCFITLPSNVQCSIVIPVTLYNDRGSLDTKELDEGTPHVFRCNVTDVAPVRNMTVTWYIGHRTVFTHEGFDDSAKPANVRPSFTYEPRREDNGLNISCKIHFNLGPTGPKETQTSQAYPLRIRYPPPPITQLEDAELQVGASSVLTCFSQAIPPSRYGWDYYKTGNVEEREENGTSQLVILNATEVNIGNYTCNAGNDLGNISHMARVTVKGAHSPCPIQITPERLVMAYGEQHPVICNGSDADAVRNLKEVSWRVGSHLVAGARWTLEDNPPWDLTAECVATFSGMGVCRKPLDVTLYKTADQVLVRALGHAGPMVANRKYRLRCDVINVAPVLNLTVTWYQGEESFWLFSSVLQVTDCPQQNQGLCMASPTPVNVSSTITVLLGRNPARVQFRLFRGYPEDLVCEADGRPAPQIHWSSDHGVPVSGGTLTVTEAGVYTCNATNAAGSDVRVVEVTLGLKETADQVLVRALDHAGPMVANRKYRLRCDVINVAPVLNLTVTWYQGEEVIQDNGSVQVTDCPPQNPELCVGRSVWTPVNVSSTITVLLGRNPGRAQFRCEARLTLGPQAPPPMTSPPLNITVHYEPIINSTKLPDSIPVFRGYPEDLVCEADGRPAPQILWFSDHGVPVSGGNLTVTEAGVYTCNATNAAGSRVRVVLVVFKEDYLPLIAGLVATTVVVTSAVFALFYSIYYKNTKMRHYSLKNPKLSTPNGNVAHNSCVTPLPMTKLS